MISYSELECIDISGITEAALMCLIPHIPLHPCLPHSAYTSVSLLFISHYHILNLLSLSLPAFSLVLCIFLLFLVPGVSCELTRKCISSVYFMVSNIFPTENLFSY